MKRRDFLNAAAVTAGGGVLGGASARGRGATEVAWLASRGRHRRRRRRAVKTEPAKVEILFKAPGLSGNGMQCTDEGIWTIDIAGSRSETPGRCKVYLSSYEGKLIRELSPEATGPSGIGVDEDNRAIWIGSTYSREIIRSDVKTGETIEKHFTPGAGVIYRRTTDIPRAAGHIRRRGRAPRRAASARARVPRADGGGGGGRWRRRARSTGQNTRAGDHRRSWRWTRWSHRRQPWSPAPGHRRARSADAERKALGRRSSWPHDLSRQPEDVDGRAHVSDRWIPAARHRHRIAGREASSGSRIRTWAASSSAT